MTEYFQVVAMSVGVAGLLWIIAGLLVSPFEDDDYTDEIEEEYPPTAPGLPHHRRKK